MFEGDGGGAMTVACRKLIKRCRRRPARWALVSLWRWRRGRRWRRVGVGGVMGGSGAARSGGVLIGHKVAHDV